MSNFSLNWYFPIMKQLAESTVFPELNEVFQHYRDGEVSWMLFLLIHK